MIIQKLKVAMVVGIFSIIVATLSVWNFLSQPEIISWFSGRKTEFTPTKAVENKKLKNEPKTSPKQPETTAKPDDKKRGN